VIFLDGSNDAVYWPAGSYTTSLVDSNIHDYNAPIFTNYDDHFSWSGFFNHASKVLSDYSALASGLSRLSKRMRGSASSPDRGTD
jgi:hypothetical protein